MSILGWLSAEIFRASLRFGNSATEVSALLSATRSKNEQLYIIYLETYDAVLGEFLYEQGYALRVVLNEEIRHIRDAVFDLKAQYGL